MQNDSENLVRLIYIIKRKVNNMQERFMKRNDV